jgi:hypothetical protein
VQSGSFFSWCSQCSIAAVAFDLMRTRLRIESMRRSGLCAALALCFFGIPATAGERFGRWSPEPQAEGIFALSFKRSIPTQDGVGPEELAFICNQENEYVVRILAPSPGTFKNEQEFIPVAIQKSKHRYDPSDVLPRWENEGEYIFSEIPDEQEDLTSYLLLTVECRCSPSTRNGSLQPVRKQPMLRRATSKFGQSAMPPTAKFSMRSLQLSYGTFVDCPAQPRRLS